MSSIAAAHQQAMDAFETPTLRMLSNHRAALIAAVRATVLPADQPRMPAALFHVKVETVLDELRILGVEVPDAAGRDLSREWLKALWLTTSSSDAGEEEYSLTSNAQSAQEFIQRETGSRATLGESRILTILDAAERAADLVNPDPDARIRRQRERVERELAELARLEAGVPVEPASDDRKLEAYLNLQSLLSAIPGDFRRVEEAMRRHRLEVLGDLGREDSSTGEIIDAYLERSDQLMEASAEGRAFRGAVELLRDTTLLVRLSEHLHALLCDEFAQALTDAERAGLRGTVTMIRQNMKLVLDERQRMSGQLQRTIEQHDVVKERELRDVLRDIERELLTWMTAATPRAAVDVEMALAKAEFGHLRERCYDPVEHAGPAPLTTPTFDDDDIWERALAEGGPDLAALREALRAAQADATTLADVFHRLPGAQRRPTELLGLFHVGSDESTLADDHGHHLYETKQSDGSTRTLRGPAIQIITPAKAPTDSEIDSTAMANAASHGYPDEPSRGEQQ
jgi:hypothetical protein